MSPISRQHLRRDRLRHQQRLHGVAGAVALGLGVVGDAHRHFRVGAVVDVDVAHAVEVLDHRDARLARQALDQLLAAARHDDVDVLAQRDQLADRGAVGGGDQLHRRSPAGPAAFSPACTHAAIARFEPSASEPPRRMQALPDFQAQRRGVGGHVGARFVDDADHAERHAHARHLDAGRPAHALRDRAHRVGERRHLLDAFGHLLDALRVQRQPVDEGRVAAGLLRLLRRPWRSPPGSPSRASGSRRHGGERAVLRGGIRARELARGGARAPTQLLACRSSPAWTAILMARRRGAAACSSRPSLANSSQGSSPLADALDRAVDARRRA